VGCTPQRWSDASAIGGVDAHNDVVRYAWKIVDPQGRDVLEGLDVAKRVDEGGLQRIS
jgi:hypothetical protein